MAQDRNPSSGNVGDVAIGIHGVETWTPPEDQIGDGILFRTTRGDLRAIRHGVPDSDLAVVWVCGARGGFGGPGPRDLLPSRRELPGAGYFVAASRLPLSQRPVRVLP